ncbi:hypothetical protein H4R23_005953, partial [Coemansia sp. Cherry 401B]
MKYCQTTRIVAIGMLGLVGVLSAPDVAGTKTVIISLATGDQGEIIPFVLTSNSNGLVPVSSTAGWQDTSVEIVAPEENEPSEPVATVDSASEEASFDSVVDTENSNVEESSLTESAALEASDADEYDSEDESDTEAAEKTESPKSSVARNSGRTFALT